jgi:hypothetical protein
MRHHEERISSRNFISSLSNDAYISQPDLEAILSLFVGHKGKEDIVVNGPKRFWEINSHQPHHFKGTIWGHFLVVDIYTNFAKKSVVDTWDVLAKTIVITKSKRNSPLIGSPLPARRLNDHIMKTLYDYHSCI